MAPRPTTTASSNPSPTRRVPGRTSSTDSTFTAPQPRRIRRYGNRKLYDPEAGRYVTLQQLAELVGAGHELLVTDQASGEDLTNATLAQVLLEQMRGGASRIPRQVLTRLIRLASGPPSAWSRWPEPQDLAGRGQRCDARGHVDIVADQVIPAAHRPAVWGLMPPSTSTRLSPTSERTVRILANWSCINLWPP